jgi:predicted dinucleotide-binding enzyme
MKCATIGSGKIDTALMRAVAGDKIEVAIANTGGPETLVSSAKDSVPSSFHNPSETRMRPKISTFVRRLR